MSTLQWTHLRTLAVLCVSWGHGGRTCKRTWTPLVLLAPRVLQYSVILQSAFALLPALISCATSGGLLLPLFFFSRWFWTRCFFCNLRSPVGSQNVLNLKHFLLNFFLQHFFQPSTSWGRSLSLFLKFYYYFQYTICWLNIYIVYKVFMFFKTPIQFQDICLS